MLAIYETDIRNWKELGGPDRPIKFYNTEEGRGPWEMLAHWLYGDVRKAPLGKFERVGSSEETRNLVEFNAGSLAVVPLRWADGKSVFPLALIGDNGEVIAPTPENLASDKYPLSRPLLLISGERPTGPARKILQFMYGEGGKKALRDADFVPQEEIAPVTPP
jgi:phosphate transport system substrate-binding protein